MLARLPLRGDEVLLDAGCGSGRLTADLAEALPRGRVVGVDLSQNMLSAARSHLDRRRVSLVACDLLQLPFIRIFDGVVSTAAFHWVLDHVRLFRELARIIVPGGWLEAQCGGGSNVKSVRVHASKIAATPRFAPYFRKFREPWCFQDAGPAADCLRGAGFVDVETSLEPAMTVLKDAAEYKEYVTNIVLRRHLMELPSEELRDEFMDEVTAGAAQDDPPYSLDYCRLNLRGRIR